MTFKPAIWFPIAAGLSVLNLVGVAFAEGSAHTTIHAVLALGFGLWAQRLGRTSGAPPTGSEFQGELGALEAEMSKLRQELSETQERLDFVERMLAQRAEAPRVGPQR
jgi:HAMP domain-containing protein